MSVYSKYFHNQRSIDVKKSINDGFAKRSIFIEKIRKILSDFNKFVFILLPTNFLICSIDLEEIYIEKKLLINHDGVDIFICNELVYILTHPDPKVLIYRVNEKKIQNSENQIEISFVRSFEIIDDKNKPLKDSKNICVLDDIMIINSKSTEIHVYKAFIWRQKINLNSQIADIGVPDGYLYVLKLNGELVCFEKNYNNSQLDAVLEIKRMKLMEIDRKKRKNKLLAIYLK
jgi:hypothetical protein